jgi:hypothetical protein
MSYCDGHGGLTQTQREQSDPTCRTECYGPSDSHGRVNQDPNNMGCSPAQVCSAMRAAPSDSEVQINGFSALRTSDVDEVVEAGGIPLIIGTMERLRSLGVTEAGANVQGNGCFALDVLARQSPAAGEAIRANNGVEVARAAMRQFPTIPWRGTIFR